MLRGYTVYCHLLVKGYCNYPLQLGLFEYRVPEFFIPRFKTTYFPIRIAVNIGRHTHPNITLFAWIPPLYPDDIPLLLVDS